jgi:hypothetical protein
MTVLADGPLCDDMTVLTKWVTEGFFQCSGSRSGAGFGSVGSVSFWAFRIWILNYLYRSGSGSFYQQAMYLQLVISKTNGVKKTILFFVDISKATGKRNPDPDP